MEQLLLNLGLSISANAVWDFLKSLGTLSKNSFRKSLINFLSVQSEENKADKMIDFLIKNNYIKTEPDNKISILLENINAKGDVTGFEGNTSNPQVKEIFENKPMDITMKQVNSGGNVTGMKLNVDDRAELKKPLNIQTDFGNGISSKVQFNPGNSNGITRRIIFGGSVEED